MRKEKTESYAFSNFGNGITRRWKRKSTAGRFANFYPFLIARSEYAAIEL